MLSGADWLVIGGGALEAVGGLTIAFDIRKTSKEFRRYEKRPRSIYAHAATMELAALVGAVGVVVSGGREPTVEDRLDSLEERINSFQPALDDTSRKLKADLKEWTRRELNGAIDVSERVIQDWQHAFERLLRGLTVGGIRLRLVGLVLVLLGVVSATIGSVVGT